MDHRLTQEDAKKTIAFLKGELVTIMRNVATMSPNSAQFERKAQMCVSLSHVLSYIRGNLNTPEVIKPDVPPVDETTHYHCE